jgi:Zn-finger nucleic acid-binding protein
MDCPVCKKGMVVLELNKVEIDHCVHCRGIWLDSGELQLLLGHKKDETIEAFASAGRVKEKPRKCPMCLKKMDKVLCGHPVAVMIDKCRKNHGLWFDKDELGKIIEEEGAGKSGEISVLLKDIFRESRE